MVQRRTVPLDSQDGIAVRDGREVYVLLSDRLSPDERRWLGTWLILKLPVHQRCAVVAVARCAARHLLAHARRAAATSGC